MNSGGGHSDELIITQYSVDSKSKLNFHHIFHNDGVQTLIHPSQKNGEYFPTSSPPTSPPNVSILDQNDS